MEVPLTSPSTLESMISAMDSTMMHSNDDNVCDTLSTR